ncbi:MAG: hypothetical protein LBK58_04055 [Prevotellaceae bacterium]|jgi:hypothetical protein|nr:hypothetical protein [Prevotellaceae bacterium]
MEVDLFQLKQFIMEMSEMGAIKACRQMCPAADEITRTEACRVAGDRRWLDRMIREKKLNAYRRSTSKNSKKYYSRSEIAALKAAERLSQERK